MSGSPKDAAREMGGYFAEIAEQVPVSNDPLLAAMCMEVSGIFSGQANGRILTGQSRLGEQLTEIVRRMPPKSVDSRLLQNINFSASYGLTVDGNPIEPNLEKSHTTKIKNR